MHKKKLQFFIWCLLRLLLNHKKNPGHLNFISFKTCDHLISHLSTNFSLIIDFFIKLWKLKQFSTVFILLIYKINCTISIPLWTASVIQENWMENSTWKLSTHSFLFRKLTFFKKFSKLVRWWKLFWYFREIGENKRWKLT
jgi:hypothetical protein